MYTDIGDIDMLVWYTARISQSNILKVEDRREASELDRSLESLPQHHDRLANGKEKCADSKDKGQGIVRALRRIPKVGG
ncbi:hypothetical protein O3M35_000431 [Rhynocoris fuscipes]|uniref:Uncharacterized protein n=1 Tax=Rhynocoris fuscipes TaxID=488301 RepID=A0AAW1DPE6_9HEMI